MDHAIRSAVGSSDGIDGRKTVRSWLEPGAAAPPEVIGYARRYLGPDDRASREAVLTRLLAGVAETEHASVLAARAAEYPNASLRVCKLALEEDLSGPRGRAAAIALRDLEPTRASLPLVRLALSSPSPVVRSCAAEYLSRHPMPATKAMAVEQLEVESDPLVQQALRAST